MQPGESENLRLRVLNTFLHVEDASERQRVLRPSKSESSISSSPLSDSKSASSAESERPLGWRDPRVAVRSDPHGHTVFNSSSDSSNENPVQSGTKAGNGMVERRQAWQEAQAAQAQGSDPRAPRSQASVLEPKPRKKMAQASGPYADSPWMGEELGPTWSLGAGLHATDQCYPCAWFMMASGCNNGKECTFCHMCSKGVIKGKRRETAKIKKKEIKEALGAAGIQGGAGVRLPLGGRAEKTGTTFRGYIPPHEEPTASERKSLKLLPQGNAATLRIQQELAEAEARARHSTRCGPFSSTPAQPSGGEGVPSSVAVGPIPLRPRGKISL